MDWSSLGWMGLPLTLRHWERCFFAAQICLLRGKGSSVFGSAHQRLELVLLILWLLRWNWDASHLLVLHSAPPKHLRWFHLKAPLDPQNPHGHQLRGQIHEATTRLNLELRSKRPDAFLGLDMFQSWPRGKQCDSCFHLSGDGPSHCPLSSLPRKWSWSAGGRPWHRWLPDFLEVAPLDSHNADMIFDRTLNALLCLSTNYNYNNRRRFDLPCLFPARSKRQKAKGNIARGTEPNEGIGTVLVAEVAACFCSTALSSTWGKRKAIHRKTINWLRLRLLKQKEGRRCSKCPSLVRNYFESVSAPVVWMHTVFQTFRASTVTCSDCSPAPVSACRT